MTGALLTLGVWACALGLWFLNGRLSELTDSMRVGVKESKESKEALRELRAEIRRVAGSRRSKGPDEPGA